MENQINMFLSESDILKIEAYLKTKGFIFLKDEITTEKSPFQVPFLMNQVEYARFITLPNAKINFNEWQENDQQKYRISVLGTEAIRFRVFDKTENIFQVRFYFSWDDWQEIKDKNLDFEQFTMSFMQWLVAKFEPMADMPSFYRNAEVVLE